MLIHIGYHKTASTALQEHFFGAPESGFVRWEDDRRLTHPYLVCHSPFAPVPAEIRDELGARARQARDAEKCFVVSHERLSGYFATGGFDSEAIARRLCTAFPAARVLIVVREQRAMLESFYSQYVTDGGVLPFGKFMRPISRSLRRSPDFDLDYLLYDRLAQLYMDLLGPANVLVLPFELLARRPADFLGRIAAHCGVPIDGERFAGGLPRTNDRRSVLLQELVRQVNRLQRSQLNPGGLFESLPINRLAGAVAARCTPAAEFVTPGFVARALSGRRRARIAQLVRGRFEDSNARLESLAGLALDEWGYALPREPADFDPASSGAPNARQCPA